MTSIFLIKDKSKKEKSKMCIMRFLKRSQAVTMIEPLAPILHIMPSTSLLAFTTKQLPLQENRKSRFSLSRRHFEMRHMAYFNFADINQGDANHLFRPEQGQMCLLVHVHYSGA